MTTKKNQPSTTRSSSNKMVKTLMLLSAVVTAEGYVVAPSSSTTTTPPISTASTGNLLRKEQKDNINPIIHEDTTEIGTLRVPNVGIGTISWSSTGCKLIRVRGEPKCLVVLDSHLRLAKI